MPHTTEQGPFSTFEQSPSNQVATVELALARSAIFDVGKAAENFHGGRLIGRQDDGYHLSVDQVTVGTGEDYKSAVQNTWEEMRKLETVRTNFLARIEMTASGASVDFTKLEHYAPKMAPGREKYPIPDYLSDSIEDGIKGEFTYRNTIEQEGWQTELRSLIETYIVDSPDGAQLAESLDIRSLSHLTPEQATKLSAAFVQNVSKYENDNRGEPAGERADGMTAYELLREGMDRKNDPSWSGNGVCRNIASNVKAVFEALKETQADMSMLRNTYCSYAGGWDGAGYRNNRSEDTDDRRSVFNLASSRIQEGHAWNKFVTIDKDGSAAISIVDATWGLGQDIESAVEHLDYTELRGASEIMSMFEESETKMEAFSSLTNYTNRTLIYGATHKRLGAQQRLNLSRYVTTEYLAAATALLKTEDGLPEGYSLPGAVVTGANSLRDEINQQEIETLFLLDAASGGMERERIGRMVAVNYTKGRHMPEQYLFRSNDFQELVFEVVDETILNKAASRSGRFRVKLREYRSDLLPPFDFNREEDAMELRELAHSNHITYPSNPEGIMKEFRRRLEKISGSKEVAAAIMVNRSDYDLAKNFRAISQALQGGA